MKLFASFSEAIREGAKLHPQGNGELMVNGYTCAIGAGLVAIGGPFLAYAVMDSSGDGSAAEVWYPYLSGPTPLCPERCEDIAAWDTSYELMDMLWHLNDDHEWTREAIADWLETEEEKLGFVTLYERDTVGQRAICSRGAEIGATLGIVP